VVAEESAVRADLVAVSAQDPGERAVEMGRDRASQIHAIVHSSRDPHHALLFSLTYRKKNTNWSAASTRGADREHTVLSRVEAFLHHRQWGKYHTSDRGEASKPGTSHQLRVCGTIISVAVPILLFFTVYPERCLPRKETNYAIK
jgi:hypothetical protein